MNEKNRQEPNGKKRIDVDARHSDRPGISGFFETILRRFRLVSFLAALIPVYLLAVLSMGLSAAPAVWIFESVRHAVSDWSPALYYATVSCTLVGGYFIYGFTLIFVVPLFNIILPLRLKPFRAGYFSMESVPWYFHNALTYVVRYTFLNFITPTPLNTLFYRMMGMKMGKGVQINTTNISDPCLIELGDRVTIGGSAHIIAHYASKGYLVTERVIIRDRATVGLKATVMGDVQIGEEAVVGPHELVLPKSRIPPGRRAFEDYSDRGKRDEKNSTRDG